MVVHNLYLLNRDGLSLVDITVGSLKFDPPLASGFFSAIAKFTQELMKSDKEVLQDMGLLNMRLYFIFEPPVMGVIAVDPEDNKEEVTSVTKDILLEFKQKYDLDNWDNDTYPFEKFKDHMKNKIEQYNDDIKEQIFYEAFKIYNKYKNYGIDEEWDEKIEEFYQEFSPRFLTVAGTVPDYMGSKLMKETYTKEPKPDPNTKLTLSDTSLNIWNKDMFLIRRDALESLQEIDKYFAAKPQLAIASA